MCNRYTITILPSDLELWLNVKSPPAYKPRFNAAPFQFLPIIRNENPREAVMAYWGNFPEKDEESDPDNPRVFRITIDSIKSKKSLKYSLIKNRCLILADSFYCWKRIGKKKKVPYRVLTKQRKLMCFAGVCSEYYDTRNDTNKISFKIITRPAYKPVNEVTDQMPVVLEEGKEIEWLVNKNPSDVALIRQMEIEDWALLNYYAVSPNIENTNLDNPDLIKPAPASDQHGNLTLFT